MEPRSHIGFCSSYWLQSLEANCPGTLLNNCSFELWQKRCMHGNYEEGKSDSERKDIFASRAPTGAAPGAG